MTTSDSGAVELASHPAITFGIATHIGGRTANADAATVEHNPLGLGAAVVDGIGSEQDVCAAARRAADTAAFVASHRGAQTGIMAAADVMPEYDDGPNAVAAVVSLVDGQIEIAHVGDCAVWTWSPSCGLTRWTVDQTAGQHIDHMLTNPGLSAASRQLLERHGKDVIEVMSDYVLNGLKYAAISTVSWTPLRGEHAEPDLVLITSDGVHKELEAGYMADLVGHLASDPQVLAERLVGAAVGGDEPEPGADNATAVVIRFAREGQ